MRAHPAVLVLAGAAVAVAVAAYRSWPAENTAASILPQVYQSPSPAAGVDEPLAAPPQRSTVAEAPDVEGEGSASESPREIGEQADASGMTPQQKLECVLNGHQMPMEFPLDASPVSSHMAEVAFAGRCVMTILRENGRADYGDPAELERRDGFSLNTSGLSQPCTDPSGKMISCAADPRASSTMWPSRVKSPTRAESSCATAIRTVALSASVPRAVALAASGSADAAHPANTLKKAAQASTRSRLGAAIWIMVGTLRV